MRFQQVISVSLGPNANVMVSLIDIHTIESVVKTMGSFLTTTINGGSNMRVDSANNILSTIDSQSTNSKIVHLTSNNRIRIFVRSMIEILGRNKTSKAQSVRTSENPIDLTLPRNSRFRVTLDGPVLRNNPFPGIGIPTKSLLVPGAIRIIGANVTFASRRGDC